MGGGRGQPGGHRDVLVHRCFSYMDSYNRDIRFDNIYISTYFCQIDERRKQLVRGAQPWPRGPYCVSSWSRRAERRGEGTPVSLTSWTFYQGKRTLLPLRKAEEKTVIFPWSPSVQASEMRNLVRRPWGQVRGLQPQPRARVPERARAGRAAPPSSGPRLLGR